MPLEIVMPKLGLTMTEGLIVEWKKKEGEDVKKGEILFVLETEKVTYEVEAPEDGVLGKILVKDQETVLVGAVVAYLTKPGETVAAPPAKAPESSKSTAPPAAAPKSPAGKVKITIIGGGVGGYPAAIRAARMGAEVRSLKMMPWAVPVSTGDAFPRKRSCTPLVLPIPSGIRKCSVSVTRAMK